MHHLPFHRQIAMFKHAGVSIPASTVNGWFNASSDLLRALYYRLREIVLASDYIQVDESTAPVIDNKKKQAVKAYVWLRLCITVMYMKCCHRAVASVKQFTKNFAYSVWN